MNIYSEESVFGVCRRLTVLYVKCNNFTKNNSPQSNNAKQDAPY